MAKPKKKVAKKASSRSRSKSPSAVSKSSGRGTGPFSTKWKATPDTHFSASHRDEIDKKLVTLIKGLAVRQRTLIRTKVIDAEDKEINKRIEEANKLREALYKDFSTFLSEWNKRREHLRETRIKFLKGKTTDKGRTAVASIESSLTKVFKARSPSIASTTSPASSGSGRRDSHHSLSSQSSEHKSDSSRSSSSLSQYSNGGRGNPFSDSDYDDQEKVAPSPRHGRNPFDDEEKVAPGQQGQGRKRYGLQNDFLATAEKKLETYLRHLQKGKQTPSDKVLPEKIDAVLDLLDLAKKGDMDGFINEWKRTSSVIKTHRPKSLMGHKMKFTQAFPFEGQKLVQDLEKLEPDLYKASHKPASPSSSRSR